MDTANALPTPMVGNLKLYTNDSEPYSDPKFYSSIVGALQYLTMTRPDLAFYVNRVSQFMYNLTLNHWKAVKRILRYLKGTISDGIIFSKCSNFRLLDFADADWASDLHDRRSVTGYCVYLGTNLIFWKCHKQSKVSHSSTEAEYCAFASVQFELVSLQHLLSELGVSQKITPTIYCDN
nr:uncharacterized protein LOC112803221 [Arachis hypogaea]